ncbi:DUF1365 domain-containing protein [Litorilituus lipolyticus]|uniref:DUF1365 domain-containing protein n=1 Tax=Litorilituus lipolyticus TaxID=2491017 RepID=A0A502KLH5_9GAMM|nr:DUF1365 domain-containing protein [Litorilituus lipolyticus]TPH12084.1 DUF1365 domain-containing protein [Litorilituus lipolyticus]
MSNKPINQIYTGTVFHQRFFPKQHSFSYKLFMLALDVKQMDKQQGAAGVFGFSRFTPLWFNAKDYLTSDINHKIKNTLNSEPNSLTERITTKVQQLGGNNDIFRITMLVQVRCFGIYFSPANFYFCYNHNDDCEQMLVEVSNTPWHERHYYLVDIKKRHICEKEFQVSPFMDLNMRYHWRVKPPETSNNLFIKIENHKTHGDKSKVFTAGLAMEAKPLTAKNIFKTWCRLPVMTMKIVTSIYWQAIKLFVKRIPFIGYQTLADKKRS